MGHVNRDIINIIRFLRWSYKIQSCNFLYRKENDLTYDDSVQFNGVYRYNRRRFSETGWYDECVSKEIVFLRDKIGNIKNYSIVADLPKNY